MKEINKTNWYLLMAAVVFGACVIFVDASDKPSRKPLPKKEGMKMADKVIRSDKEWKKLLTPLQYKITRKA